MIMWRVVEGAREVLGEGRGTAFRCVVKRAGRAVQHEHARARRPRVELAHPVREHGGRREHERRAPAERARGAARPVGERAEERRDLRGFAETHLVADDAAAALRVERGEPPHADALVLEQLSGEDRRPQPEALACESAGAIYLLGHVVVVVGVGLAERAVFEEPRDAVAERPRAGVVDDRLRRAQLRPSLGHARTRRPATLSPRRGAVIVRILGVVVVVVVVRVFLAVV
mmetsp:Transcript_10605/g.42878  ORF Transcript_10605/g.42878 Transcript_10605/m.42878 type:complete len:230 (+) Transcript_10605:1646-2335(+)